VSSAIDGKAKCGVDPVEEVGELLHLGPVVDEDGEDVGVEDGAGHG